MSGAAASNAREKLRKQLLMGIEEFASEFVGNASYHRIPLPEHPKIVHDPLWGTIRLNPWEVALLDLPLFQRLRQIKQTSLVSYVFPGCTHSRFEHTLGVLQQTQRLVDAVNASCETDKLKFESSVVRNLRLAALFHDVGHSCFSHISEDLFARCEDMKAWFADPSAVQCHAHEVLSALILRSDPVRKFLKTLEERHDIEFDAEQTANWIMGAETGKGAEPESKYIGQVINGPFDADKLDYIFRDSHYSGIPLGLDLYRLWASCRVKKMPGNRYTVLALHQASVAPLEQILFNKTNLFAIVYQHPKVRAAERMFQAIIEDVQDGKSEPFETSGRRLTFKKAAEFLWFTDDTFFSEALRRQETDPIHQRIHAIRYRRLLVRALTISHDTIETDTRPASAAGYLQLRKLNQRRSGTYEVLRELARQIIKTARLAHKVSENDVWVDIPADPRYGEADRTFVVTPSGSMRKVSELFPVHYWSDLFAKHKWRGHVFCPFEHKQAIHEAAIRVLREAFQIEFRRSAGESAHVDSPKATTDLV